MLKKIAFASVGVLLLASPLLASAQTVADKEALIAALLAQVAQLQQEIAELSGNIKTGISGTANTANDIATGSVQCAAITHNMGLGDTDATTGGDVTRLQQFLVASGLLTMPTGVSFGIFGPLTEVAVRQWQSEHGIVKSGRPDTTGFGYVGPRTMTALLQACGGSTASNETTPTTTTVPPPLPVTPPLAPVTPPLAPTTPPLATAAQSCVAPWGSSVANGSSVTAYSTSNVPVGSTCVSEQRTCTNGSLSGSYYYQNCSPGAIAGSSSYSSITFSSPAVGQSYAKGSDAIPVRFSSGFGAVNFENLTTGAITSGAGLFANTDNLLYIPFDLPPGTYRLVLHAEIYDGVSNAFTVTATGESPLWVKPGSEVSACKFLSGVERYDVVGTRDARCSNGGRCVSPKFIIASTYASGQSTATYEDRPGYLPAGGIVNQIRCSASGTLPANASCTLNGTTIAHNARVDAYQSSSVPLGGAACVSEKRVCTNGTLSGTYQFSTCAPAWSAGQSIWVKPSNASAICRYFAGVGTYNVVQSRNAQCSTNGGSCVNPKFYWMPSSDWALLDDRNSSLPADGILQQVQCSATGSSSAGSVRPNIATFMTAAGMTTGNTEDFSIASDMIYGVIGSSKDTRNWGAIMASANVLQAARAATRAMYASTLQDYRSPQAIKPEDVLSSDGQKRGSLIAASGYFKFVNIPVYDSTTMTWRNSYNLFVVDSGGYAVRSISGLTDKDRRELADIGFDTTADVAALHDLEAQVAALGINIGLYRFPNGFLGNSAQSNITALSQIAGALAALEALLNSLK